MFSALSLLLYQFPKSGTPVGCPFIAQQSRVNVPYKTCLPIHGGIYLKHLLAD